MEENGREKRKCSIVFSSVLSCPHSISLLTVGFLALISCGSFVDSRDFAVEREGSSTVMSIQTMADFNEITETILNAFMLLMFTIIKLYPISPSRSNVLTECIV